MNRRSAKGGQGGPVDASSNKPGRLRQKIA